MKTRIGKVFSSAALLLCVVAMSLLTSCRKGESADAEDLLSTVPSGASMVAVVNIPRILDNAGCEVDGSKILAGPEAKAYIEKNLKGKDLARFAKVLDGESGIEPSVAVVFMQGGYTYMAGMLADADKFKKFCKENMAAGDFTTKGDVEVLQNIAVIGTRFWVSGSNSIDPQTVASFTKLSDKTSFLSNSYAERLMKVEEAVEGWANISGLMNLADIDFQQKAVTQMAIQTIYKDAQDLAFSVDFEKNEAEMKMMVLNSKEKPAEVLFPVEKIDTRQVSSLGGDCNLISAFAISQKGIKKITEAVSGNGVSMLSLYLKPFACVDGTIAAAIGDTNTEIKGFISTTGEDTQVLSDLMSSEMGIKVTRNGKTLDFSKGGAVKGALTVTEAAELMKGSMFAIVASEKSSTGFSKAALLLKPEDGSLEIEAKMIGKKGENFLIQAMKAAK